MELSGYLHAKATVPVRDAVMVLRSRLASADPKDRIEKIGVEATPQIWFANEVK